MNEYKHVHAAIRKNGREGLVFPVLGRVGHLVCMYIIYYVMHASTCVMSFPNNLSQFFIPLWETSPVYTLDQ